MHSHLRSLLTCLSTWSVLAVVLFLSYPGRSSAYLDPGSGSYIFQLALAFGLGALFTGKVYWRRIRAYIVRKLSKRE